MLSSALVGARSGSEPSGPEVLNLAQAGELLGVSAKTVLRLINAGDLPARKVGRQWRLSRRALLDWLEDEHPG